MSFADEIKEKNMYDLQYENSLYYIISEDKCEVISNRNYAVFVHIFFEDCLQNILRYLKNVPNDIDIFFSTDTEDKRKKIEKESKTILKRNVNVILVQNRGRDVSAFFCGFREISFQYDYICFIHDKKGRQFTNTETAIEFAKHCYDNLLRSEPYINNIIDLFQNNPYLGMLVPTPPYHNEYYACVGNEWSNNYDITKRLAKDYGLMVDICYEKPPLAPFGTMFWIRTKAMKKMYEVDVTYEMFPMEPSRMTDGTLMHAMERLYPFLVQESGFSVAWISTSKAAAKQGMDYYRMLRTLNSELMKQYGICNFDELVNFVKGQGTFTLLFNRNVKTKRKIQMLLKRSLSEKKYKIIRKSIIGRKNG